MKSPLYYDPYHNHDPTIISVHTLLKSQVYQQPTYINTPPSQPNQCISPLSIPYINQPLFPSNFTHLNTHSATTQYRSPQFHQPATYHLSNTNYPTPWGLYTSFNHHTPHQEPIHTITATTPPSFCGSQHLIHQPQIHTSTALHHHHHHDPYFQSQSSPVINDFTPLHLDPTLKYENETIKSHEVIADDRNYFSNADPVVVEHPANSNIITPPLLVSPHPPSPSRHAVFSTAIAEPLVTMQRKEETTKSSPILKIVAATEIAGETVFSISETDDATTKKDQVSLPPNPFSDPHDPLLCDSNGVASVTITSFGDVPKSLVPAKHRSFTTTRPSLLPYCFIVVTSNDGNTLSVSKFVFPVVCTFNFDPGGDKSSPTANSGGSRRIFSLLWLPWDRGKKSCSEVVSAFAELQCGAIFYGSFVWVL